MADIENVYDVFPPVHVKDHAVRLVDELAEVHFEVFPFPGVGAPFRKTLQGIDPGVKAFEPAGSVQRGTFVNVQE